MKEIFFQKFTDSNANLFLRLLTDTLKTNVTNYLGIPWLVQLTHWEVKYITAWGETETKYRNRIMLDV